MTRPLIQVFDLAAKLIEAAEHQRLVYACGGRPFSRRVGVGAIWRASRAAAVYLNAQQLIPEERTAETLADLFGVPGLCPTSVMD